MNGEVRASDHCVAQCLVTTVAQAIPVRTPLLTGADIGATVDKAGKPDFARRKVTELGFVKMFAVALGRTLADSDTGYHNTGYACY